MRPVAKSDGSGGRFGYCGGPAVGEPIARRRRRIADALGLVLVELGEERDRGGRGPGPESPDRRLELVVPQQRALAAPRRTQDDQRGLGDFREQRAEVGMPLRPGRPAPARRILALIDEQRKSDEPPVQPVARLAPGGDPPEAVLRQVVRAPRRGLACQGGREDHRRRVVVAHGGQRRGKQVGDAHRAVYARAGEGRGHALLHVVTRVGQHVLDQDAVARGEGGRRPGRRGDVLQPGSEDLEDAVGVPQVLEAMRAPVAQGPVWRQVALHELLGGERQEHLAAVTGCFEPRRPVDGGAEVVPAALLGDPDVDPHADAQRREVGGERGPVFGGDGVLGVDGRAGGLHGRMERGAERVTDGLEHKAAVRRNAGAEQIVVALERLPHRAWEVFPAGGRALDVGEQKGDGAGRVLRHVRAAGWVDGRCRDSGRRRCYQTCQPLPIRTPMRRGRQRTCGQSRYHDAQPPTSALPGRSRSPLARCLRVDTTADADLITDADPSIELPGDTPEGEADRDHGYPYIPRRLGVRMHGRDGDDADQGGRQP